MKTSKKAKRFINGRIQRVTLCVADGKEIRVTDNANICNPSINNALVVWVGNDRYDCRAYLLDIASAQFYTLKPRNCKPPLRGKRVSLPSKLKKQIFEKFKI